MNAAQAFPDLLPATIAERRVSIILPWIGHGQVRVWLTPDRDLALDVNQVVELLDITEPATFEMHPVTWMHQWTPPPTRAIVTTYLWSRAAVERAAGLAASPELAAAFVSWLAEHHRDMCLRDWEGTLDAVLDRISGTPDRSEVAIADAAASLVDLLGVAVTRDELFADLERMGWIARLSGGRGWRPTLEARARATAFSRVRKLPGAGGHYEQCYLTQHGYTELAASMRARLENGDAS
ncbi:hypothetical protein MUN78_07115 [Leucobacter allii]|uniref:Uncharacterized protein n=1 Tax=Leucobacter allii TaxID=2932247 RepID=A0ABY4FQQ2_9MICO|nr:hypothetical protein [Leucobacter allii]UOQ58587.1 hypothetical protein MUN78_07115 [Leucobacter allii]